MINSGETTQPFDRNLGAVVVTAIMARQGKRSGKEIKFVCPCHDDQHPSAEYNLDKQVWNCQVCNASGGLLDLADRLGLQASQSSTKQTEPTRIVCTYDYTDADGKVLYQVVRYEPKTFKQRHPSPNGEWVWSMEGITPVPYRLPNLVYARDGEMVFIVEGEKDADSLITCGLVATTNHGGAGKWEDHHSKYLTGRRVVLVPDCDEAGRRHVAKAGRSLQQAGVASLKMLELPGLGHKQDVSDWLALGHSSPELLTLATDAPEWEPPSDLFEVLGDSPAKPIMERAGLGYLFRYPQEKINILLDHLVHTGRDGVGAEIMVTGQIPMAPARLHWGKVTLASIPSRKAIVKELTEKTKGAGINWPDIIEDVCYQVAMEERKGEPFLWLHDVEEGTEDDWVIENFAPRGDPTTIFGQGSAGKSRLALAMALSLQAGKIIIPGYKPMTRLPVLYLDFETGPLEIKRRCKEICTGAGIPTENLRYRRCMGRSLADQIEDVLRECQQIKAGLLLVDSVEMASVGERERGGDVNEAVIRMHSALRLLNISSILIDHIGKVGIADPKVPRNPYGSIFKNNLSRMVYELRGEPKAPGQIALGLFNTKRNNGGLPFPPVGLTVEFEAGKYTRYSTGVVSRPNFTKGMSGHEKITTVLRENGHLSADEVAREADMPLPTVSSLLSRGKADGCFMNPSRNKWTVVDPDTGEGMPPF